MVHLTAQPGSAARSALIVTKSSNLERIGDKVKARVDRGLIPSFIYDNFIIAHDQHYGAIQALKDELDRHGVPFVEASRSDKIKGVADDRFDAVFSVGGDGTLLAATDQVGGSIPIIGIKSSDTSIGYLCTADRHRIPAVVAAYCAGSLDYTPRPRMVAHIHCDDPKVPTQTTVPVLNDFLFANSHPAATSRYVLQVGEVTEEHKSSGIWLATPAGSTAGVMAAGGTPQHSVTGQFQYLVREMYAGDEVKRTLTGGTFVPGTDPIVITNLNPEGLLALDGSKITYDLPLGAVVTFAPCPPATIAERLK